MIVFGAHFHLKAHLKKKEKDRKREKEKEWLVFLRYTHALPFVAAGTRRKIRKGWGWESGTAGASWVVELTRVFSPRSAAPVVSLQLSSHKLPLSSRFFPPFPDRSASLSLPHRPTKSFLFLITFSLSRSLSFSLILFSPPFSYIEFSSPSLRLSVTRLPENTLQPLPHARPLSFSTMLPLDGRDGDGSGGSGGVSVPPYPPKHKHRDRARMHVSTRAFSKADNFVISAPSKTRHVVHLDEGINRLHFGHTERWNQMSECSNSGIKSSVARVTCRSAGSDQRGTPTRLFVGGSG